MTAADHALFALAWISFGLVHSLLATDTANRLICDRIGGFTRIFYNIIATVHLSAILILEWRGFPGKIVFDLPLWVHLPMVGIQTAGWLLAFIALVQYDLGRFGGLTQAKVIVHRRDDDRFGPGSRPGSAIGQANLQRYEPAEDIPQARLEPLVTHGIHRFVRHPLYVALIIVLWARAFDEAALMTAFWGTAYILIGTHFEERKLMRIYGDDYAAYKARVPRFVPRFGRASPRK